MSGPYGLGFVEPSKGLVTTFQMVSSGKQYDLIQYVHCVRIYESICKPYLTIQVILYDNNNLIENIGAVPGDAAVVQIASPPNANAYTIGQMNLLKLKGEQAQDTLKYQVYTLDFIGPIYFQDRSASVTDSGFGQMPATSAIQTIWGKYLNADNLTILQAAATPAGSQEQPLNVAGQKPLTAINKIMKSMVSSTFAKTGNWLLFKNRDGVYLTQLEALLAQLTTAGNSKGGGGAITNQFSANGQREYYVQKETWGGPIPGAVGWGTGFNDPDIYHAIIAAQAESRASAVDISGAGGMNQFVYDLGLGQVIQQGLGKITIPDISALYSGISGQQPSSGTAMAGMQITDSSRWPNATAPWTKTIQEKQYSAMVRGSPQLTLKVPLQTGLNSTVGTGIYVYLLPPVGDVSNYNLNNYLLVGAWLVTDIVHELFTDMREAPGTTSIKATKGSIGAGDSESGSK